MKPLKQQKIAVLMGGSSQERAVSLQSGAAVLQALQSQGFNAVAVDPSEFPVAELKTQGFERAFNILHGRGGEDGVMQGLLESLGIPYTGCGVLASALSMDKMRTKLLWQACGLPVAKMAVVQRAALFGSGEPQLDCEQIVRDLGLPLMVKPSLEGSSVGLTKVNGVDELLPAVLNAMQFDDTVLVEEWLAGQEFTVPILGEEVLPAVRIQPANEFYDYDAKYLSDDTQYFCPAGLSDDKEQEIRTLAKRAFDVLGCNGWTRIDVMTNAQGEFRLVEANTCPGMTSHSLFPMSARQQGYSFEQLVVKILELSL